MIATELVKVRRMAATGVARRIRLDAGLSLSEIAADAGTHKENVWRWEMGQRRPRGDAAIRYLRVLEELATR